MPTSPWINEAALFLHVIAAIGLVGGGIVQVFAGIRLRDATDRRDIRTWATFARSAGPLIIVAAFLSLMTGGHLAGAMWSFSHPFVTLGAAGLLVLAPVGPMVGGARLRRLALTASDDTVAEEQLHAAANEPALWGPVHSLVGVGVGLTWLMTNKPGWAAGVAGLLVTFAAGWVSGVVVARRSPVQPVVQAARQ